MAFLRADSPGSESVTTAETQSSGSGYGDLATVGPAVTMTTGTSALVILCHQAYVSASAQSAWMGVAVSGATTIAPESNLSAVVTSSIAGYAYGGTMVQKITGLTAGSNTFTAKYGNTGGGSWTFRNRTITVIPL